LDYFQAVGWLEWDRKSFPGKEETMAASQPPRTLVEIAYAEAAREYLRKLPREHFMESTPQATQRKITLESMDLVHVQRPDIQTFNELLIQKRVGKRKKPVQVVPDNMVVVCGSPIKAEGSYAVPLQPVGPFWVLEYVSKSSKRKDYEDNHDKYEQVFQVPYYLTFHPDEQELTLFQLKEGRYVSVKPNDHGRYSIPELDLEPGLLDGWVRFWFRGDLLPLPADLQRDLEQTRRELEETKRQVESLKQQQEEDRRVRQALEAELERLRALLPRPEGK
jgi:Uma2 family endonuclease